MTAPQPPAGWYPDPDGGAAVRWWDGAQWAAPSPAASTGAQRPKTGQKAALTPVGQFLVLFGLLLIAGGLYVGVGLHAHSVGVDGTTLDDLAAAHQVDCGTAFSVTYSSPLCEDALSGKKTAAIVMIVVGVGSVIGARVAFKKPDDA